MPDHTAAAALERMAKVVVDKADHVALRGFLVTSIADRKYFFGRDRECLSRQDREAQEAEIAAAERLLAWAMADPRIILPSADAPKERRYQMPNPDALRPAYDRMYRRVFYSDKASTTTVPLDDDLKRLLALAKGYLDLTTYELGQECCVGKLRDIWRHRRREGLGA